MTVADPGGAARGVPQAMLLALAACAPAQPEAKHWERPGASAATIFRDASDCSTIAWTEAERLHPYDYTPPPAVVTVHSRWLQERQRVDTQRFSTANRLDDRCMESRGYRRGSAPPR